MQIHCIQNIDNISKLTLTPPPPPKKGQKKEEEETKKENITEVTETLYANI